MDSIPPSVTMAPGERRQIFVRLRGTLKSGGRHELGLVATSETGEACACDLVEPLGRSQPTVSHHLSMLVDAGTITRAQAEAIKAEFQEYGSSKTDGRTASLAKLVSNGTITQAQSDAIAAALPAPGSKPKPADGAPRGPRGAHAPAPVPAA